MITMVAGDASRNALFARHPRSHKRGAWLLVRNRGHTSGSRHQGGTLAWKSQQGFQSLCLIV